MDQSLIGPRLPRDVVHHSYNSESRKVVPYRPAIGALHHPAFVQLYYALEARRASALASMVVQFVAPAPGAGVSTVASGYARVAAIGRSSPVLFVEGSCRALRKDMIGAERATLVEAFRRGADVGSAIAPARDVENLLWARLCDHPEALLELGATRFEELMRVLSLRYELVVLDCASIQRPEAALVSRFCDGTVLVLEAGVTSQQQTEAACKRIRQVGGLPVGVILNREKRVFGKQRVEPG